MKRLLSALLIALFASASFAQTVTTTGANAPALPGSSGAVTGSGAVVLQTSPTLTTPNIGVASGTMLHLSTGAPYATYPFAVNLGTNMNIFMQPDAGRTNVSATNDALNAYVALDLNGGPVTLQHSGVTKLSSSATGVSVTGVVDASTGFQIGSAAASGNVLRGNGTNFVSTQLATTDLSGLGTGVATALAVNVGTAGAPVVLNGAGGTPSSIVLTNATGTAASLSVAAANASDYAAGSFTPSVACGGGTITTLGTVGGNYVKIGKLVYVMWDVTITTNGTCSTFLTIGDFPYSAAAAAVATGLENNSTGYLTRGLLATSGTSVSVRYYDATYSGGTGTRNVGSVTYITP